MFTKLCLVNVQDMVAWKDTRKCKILMSLLEPHLSLGLAPIILTSVIRVAILTLVTKVTKVSLVNLVANTNPVYAPMLHEELNINLNLFIFSDTKSVFFWKSKVLCGCPSMEVRFLNPLDRVSSLKGSVARQGRLRKSRCLSFAFAFQSTLPRQTLREPNNSEELCATSLSTPFARTQEAVVSI